MSDPIEAGTRETSPEADILLFDHPVREIPDQLAVFGREATARWQEGRAEKAENENEEAGGVQEADPTARRLRVRRRGLLALAVTGLIFLAMQLSGFLPGVFLGHLPLLAFTAVLVAGGTAQRVPRGTPQFQNPLNWGIFATILFFIVGGSILQIAELDEPRDTQLWILYTATGVLGLLLLLWILWRTGPAARLRLGPGAPAAENPEDWRPASLAACQEVLKKISRNAPAGAHATGWLDLGGPEQRGNLIRDDRKGRCYRDVWWRLRLPWEDGARLRLAGVEEVQIPRGTRDRERTFQLLATLAVDPRRWRTQPGPLPAEAAGGLKVEAFEVTPSRVTARVASAQRAFRPADLIGLIKALEGKIQPLAGTGGPAEAPAGGEA